MEANLVLIHDYNELNDGRAEFKRRRPQSVLR